MYTPAIRARKECCLRRRIKQAELEAVLEHYSDGIQSNSQSLPDIENLNLSELEKEQIISFLHTLNDEKFVTNELFMP